MRQNRNGPEWLLPVQAVYERGTLKLSRELPIPDGQQVIITIHPIGSAAARIGGALVWPRDAKELHRYLNDPDEGIWGHHDV